MRVGADLAGTLARPAAAVMARYVPVLAWEAPDAIAFTPEPLFYDLARLRGPLTLLAGSRHGTTRPHSSTKGPAPPWHLEEFIRVMENRRLMSVLPAGTH